MSLNRKDSRIVELLKPQKVLRDPVHGNVFLTSLETEIIDTHAFQRLHQLKQLGLAYLVYPGATHTRFSHSIGTLQASQKLIDVINRSLLNETRLGPYPILLARLCALLHDLSHIPFGHTLEDEGSLFPSQWEDSPRVEYFLGEESEVGAAIRRNLDLRCLSDVVHILTAKSNSDIEGLQHPFIADIIGDTFCADLLDYTSRDSLHVGFQRFPDLRLINYVCVSPYGVHKKKRVVLRIGEKHALISDILNLLRTRLDLMERVIYHHTKLRASAMVIAAVYDSLREGNITREELWQIGDEALLDRLETDGTNVSRNLVGKLRKRKLHKPVLSLPYPFFVSEVDSKARKMKEVFALYSDPHNRWLLERRLEEKYGLPEGDVIVYCPRVKRSRKSSTLLISLSEGTFPFSEIPDVATREELQLIEDHYARLWKMVVLIDNEVDSAKMKEEIVKDWEEELVPNSS